MKRKYKCTNIRWDTDGETLDLPTEVIVEIDTNTDDVEEAISDALSDQIGFCHFGFDYVRIRKNTSKGRLTF